MGKIARREFARCAAIVSITNSGIIKNQEEETYGTWPPSRLPIGTHAVLVIGGSMDRYLTNLQLRHQSLERMQKLAGCAV